jgi:hypothetical protein
MHVRDKVRVMEKRQGEGHTVLNFLVYLMIGAAPAAGVPRSMKHI